MKNEARLAATVVASAALCVAASPAGAAAWPVVGAPGYDASGNGYTLTSAPWAQPYAHVDRGVNAGGRAIATAAKSVDRNGRGSRGLAWDAADGTGLELGVLTDAALSEAAALAINDAGVVVGSARVASSVSPLSYRAVRWDAGSSAAVELSPILPFRDGYIESNANDVNAAGVVVGRSEKSSGAGAFFGYRAVRWDAGSSVAVELGTLNASATQSGDTEAVAVNDAGTIVGFGEKRSGTASVGTRAIRWAAGSTAATELGDLGLSAAGWTTARASAVNARGDAVGFARKHVAGVDAGIRALRWDAGGTAAQELGALSARADFVSYAYAVNADGYAAGMSESDRAGVVFNTNDRAVVWGPDGVPIDLTARGAAPAEGGPGTWILSAARSISDTGFVSGEGLYDPDGTGSRTAYGRGFTLMLPEAGTYGRGDATLDSRIDFDDVLVLAAHLGAANASFGTGVGDLNLDGTVDDVDLGLLGATYRTPLTAEQRALVGETFAEHFTLAQGIVPEPATLAVVGGTLMTLARRRRRAN